MTVPAAAAKPSSGNVADANADANSHDGANANSHDGAQDRLLAARLRLAVGRLHRRIRLATNDVPPLQLSTLVTLDQYGRLRSGELAHREAVTAPTMTRVLSALTDRGLIQRSADPGDARSVLVSLTPEGARRLDQIRSERTALLGARLARLTPEQRAALDAAIPALEALIED